MHPEDDTILQLASTVVDALGDQVEVHVDLARAEFARDARALLRQAAPLAVGFPLLAVGYLLASIGLALGLVPWLGPWGGFVLVGGVNFAIGGWVARAAMTELLSHHAFQPTVGQEVAKSAKSLVAGLGAKPQEVHPAL